MKLQMPIASYQHRSTVASTSRVVNAFAEQTPPDANGPVILTRTAGVQPWATVGTGPIRAMHAALDYLWVVSGGDLYQVDSNGTSTLIGTVGPADDIDIDSNVDTVVVVVPPLAYYYQGGVFAQISDADFTARGALDVEFIDNFLTFVDYDSGRFFGSDLSDATSYDSLSFATAEGSPDELVGHKADHRQLLLFGAKSVEVWFVNGLSGFPFERLENGFIEIGCLNGRTVAKIDNSVFWVADDHTVRRLDGTVPVRVSTHAVEQWLREATSAELRGYAHSFEGHLLYELKAPEGTFVYDITTQLWHEKQTYGQTNWRWIAPTVFNEHTVVGDSTGADLGILDPDTYDDLGDTLRMEWTYQPVYADGIRAFHNRLELVCEVGVGTTSGQGVDPQIMLEKSDDGGRTWSSLPTKSLGAMGNYETRVVWHALGSARQRVYRMAVSDPVRVTIKDTLLEVDGGRL